MQNKLICLNCSLCLRTKSELCFPHFQITFKTLMPEAILSQYYSILLLKQFSFTNLP